MREKTPQEQARGGRKPGARNEFSAATMSRDLREMAMASLHFVGGVKYLARVARDEPAAYLNFISKCLVREDQSTHGLTIQVVNLTSPGVPTPGVLTSPIAADVAPQRRLQLVERTDG